MLGSQGMSWKSYLLKRRCRPTSPSSGQATTSHKLLHPMLLACQSGAALARPDGFTYGAGVVTMWSRLQAVAVVRAKLIKIGNSRGVRLAKPLLEVAGLADEVEIEAAPGVLTIRPSAHPRAGWAEAASCFQPEGLIDEMSPTRFDEEEWSW